MSSNKAFELGAQCRRAGLDEKRMLDYYQHERNKKEYDPQIMLKGWHWQDQKYRVHEGDNP